MEVNSVRREEILEKIKEFRLIDDSFMSRVFDENIECTELILRIILNEPDIKVNEVHTQKEIKNLLGHSVRLDIMAVDKTGKMLDIEVQRADKGAGVKRARYNSSMIDANTLVKGEDYDKLPETYVIFITEKDVMGANLPIYHADRVVAETGVLLGDGTHIIYVNGAYRDNSPIGKLMHDFSCKNPSEMYYKELAEQVKYYKEDARGVEAMCQIVEELIDTEKKEIALAFLRLNKLSIEEIAKCSKLSLEQVEEIARDERVLMD